MGGSSRGVIAITAAAALAASAFVATGCRTAPRPVERAGYRQSLDTYYQGRPLCVWDQTVSFPIANATPETVDDLGLDALEDAGLLISHRGARSRTRTYVLTPEGRSAIDPDVLHRGAGNFCYGHRQIVSIDKARQNSSSTELVDFHYAVAQPAAWASESSIQSAFPEIVSELAGTHTAQATLLDTTDGWEVSGTPAVLLPRATRQHHPLLARLLHPHRHAG